AAEPWPGVRNSEPVSSTGTPGPSAEPAGSQMHPIPGSPTLITVQAWITSAQLTNRAVTSKPGTPRGKLTYSSKTKAPNRTQNQPNQLQSRPSQTRNQLSQQNLPSPARSVKLT